MIDEELYKIATDELNSDARKPAVWARACALASDDHDEARFLYTNLRVEEMLNKDGKQRTFSADRTRREANLSSAEKLDTLELSTPDENNPISGRPGIDSPKTLEPSLDIAELELSEIPAHASVSGTNKLSTEFGEFDDETLAELDALTKSNNKDNKALSGINGEPIESSAQNLENPSTNEIVSEVFGTSAAATRATIMSPEEQRSSELAHKLEREAQHMHDTANAVESEAQEVFIDDFEEAVSHDATSQVTALQLDDTQPDADITGALSANTTIDPNDTHEVVRSDYADANDILQVDGTMDLDDELDIGGRAYIVFSRRGDIKAVKRGVSWVALFFTFPWLLSKALFGTALVYGCLWVVSLAGLLATASVWLNAGADASLVVKLWTAGFALLAIIGLLYVPFRYGNRWVAEKLQNRGFQLEAAVSADNKREAIDRLFEPSEEI